MALGWDNVVLEYLDAICVSIQGFLNALVWLSEPFFVARVRETPLCLRLTVRSLLVLSPMDSSGLFSDDGPCSIVQPRENI